MSADKSVSQSSLAIHDKWAFSNAAINLTVASKSLNHPLTLFPTTLGLLGIFWMVLIEPSVTMALATIGAFMTGIGNLIINFFFRWNTHTSRYLTHLAQKMNDYREQSKTEIKRVLMECESMGDVGQYAQKGRKQYDDINRRFDLLQEILGKKLNRQELAYARFLGSAKQVYLNTLDNLRDLVNYIKSIAVIGNEYSLELKRLESIKNPTEVELNEIATLKERDEVRQNLQNKLNELLAVNEKALTKIDVTIAEFSKTRIRKLDADIDIETAIAELESLATHVQKYGSDLGPLAKSLSPNK